MYSAEEQAMGDFILQRAKMLAARLMRSGILAAAAVVFCQAQRHADYSVWLVGLTVLVIGSLSRYDWLALAIVVFMMALYFVTPEMVVGLKVMRVQL